VDFRGFAQESRALEGLEAGPRSVRWTQAGNHRIAVLLIPREPAASEANVTLELRIRGVLVGQGRLVLPPLC